MAGAWIQKQLVLTAKTLPVVEGKLARFAIAILRQGGEMLEVFRDVATDAASATIVYRLPVRLALRDDDR